MKSLYVIVTHFCDDRSTRLCLRLLNRYRSLFYQNLLDTKVVLLTTGTSLNPGIGEDIFVRLPNPGHHEGDLEMFNLGVHAALSYGAKIILKLSGNRLFLDGGKLATLIRRLGDSEYGALGDHWNHAGQISTDVCLLKDWFAKEIFPLPVNYGSTFAEHVMGAAIEQAGLGDRILIYDERQPIHLEDGRRRTSYYENIELLTNSERRLEAELERHHPWLVPLAGGDDPEQDPCMPVRSFDDCTPARTEGLVLVEKDGAYELHDGEGNCHSRLNESAAVVWSLCDGSNTVAGIKEQVAGAYRVDVDTVAGDVQGSLEALLQTQGIELVVQGGVAVNRGSLAPAALEAARRLQARGDTQQAELRYSMLYDEYPQNADIQRGYARILLDAASAGQRSATPAGGPRRGTRAFVQRLVGLGGRLVAGGDAELGDELLWLSLKYQPDNYAVHLSLSARVLVGEHYLSWLTRLHRRLRPGNYVEIGVETGQSLAVAGSEIRCLGIDPYPKIGVELGAMTRLYPVTSDTFFSHYDLVEELDGRPVELAFIDGQHLFEAALRDFVNIERYSTGKTVVLLHDAIPLSRDTAARERSTQFWSGDVWKVIPCLKKYRPDLRMISIPSPPTGIVVLANLDPGSQVLAQRWEEIVTEFAGMDYDVLSKDKDAVLSVADSDWPEELETMLRAAGDSGSA